MVDQEDKGQGLLVPCPVLALGEGTKGQMSCPVLLSSLIRYRRELDMRREIKAENAEQAKMQGTSMRFAQCPADASVAPMRAPPMTVAVVGQSRGRRRCKIHGGASCGPRTPEGKARSYAAPDAGRAAYLAHLKATGQKRTSGRPKGAKGVTESM